MLGVDAIRLLDYSWDQHRGPLYPELWYMIFSLYDPHLLPPQNRPEEIETPNFDEPATDEPVVEEQVAPENDSNNPVVTSRIFAL